MKVYKNNSLKGTGGTSMRSQFAELLREREYEEEELEVYQEYRPHKMTKQEFVREMMRLQEEKNLY